LLPQGNEKKKPTYADFYKKILIPSCFQAHFRSAISSYTPFLSQRRKITSNDADHAFHHIWILITCFQGYYQKKSVMASASFEIAASAFSCFYLPNLCIPSKMLIFAVVEIVPSASSVGQGGTRLSSSPSFSIAFHTVPGVEAASKYKLAQ
jgi:hypothetical protein